jgi:hypothetical protein
MVLIHCKGKSDDHQFLYETTTETPVSTVVRELVEIHNLRLRIQRLKVEGDELAQHGPARHPDKQGLDEDLQAEADGVLAPERGPTFCKDPNGKRDGNAPVAQVATMLRKALDDAAHVASKKQVTERRAVTTKKMLMDAIDVVRGAVMIAYPMGIPEWDPVRMDIEADEKPGDTPAGAGRARSNKRAAVVGWEADDREQQARRARREKRENQDHREAPEEGRRRAAARGARERGGAEGHDGVLPQTAGGDGGAGGEPRGRLRELGVGGLARAQVALLGRGGIARGDLARGDRRQERVQLVAK